MVWAFHHWCLFATPIDRVWFFANSRAAVVGIFVGIHSAFYLTEKASISIFLRGGLVSFLLLASFLLI